jgi:hypothetical protein
MSNSSFFRLFSDKFPHVKGTFAGGIYIELKDLFSDAKVKTQIKDLKELIAKGNEEMKEEKETKKVGGVIVTNTGGDPIHFEGQRFYIKFL